MEQASGRHSFFIAIDLEIPRPSVTMNPQSQENFSEEMHASFDSVMNGTDAFVAVDYNLNFLFVNARAEHFYQKNRSELLGQNLKSVYPTEMEFGPFKSVIRNVAERKNFELSYQSPFVKDWVQLIGRAFENYYTFTYRIIDYKQALRDELRTEMKRKK